LAKDPVPVDREVQPNNPPAVRIGHPSGTIQVGIEAAKSNGGLQRRDVKTALLKRTFPQRRPTAAESA